MAIHSVTALLGVVNHESRCGPRVLEVPGPGREERAVGVVDVVRDEEADPELAPDVDRSPVAEEGACEAGDESRGLGREAGRHAVEDVEELARREEPVQALDAVRPHVVRRGRRGDACDLLERRRLHRVEDAEGLERASHHHQAPGVHLRQHAVERHVGGRVAVRVQEQRARRGPAAVPDVQALGAERRRHRLDRRKSGRRLSSGGRLPRPRASASTAPAWRSCRGPARGWLAARDAPPPAPGRWRAGTSRGRGSPRRGRGRR